MNDAADHARVIDPRLAPRVGGKMRRNLRKLRVRLPEVIENHRRFFSESRESQCRAHANHFISLDPKLIFGYLALSNEFVCSLTDCFFNYCFDFGI